MGATTAAAAATVATVATVAAAAATMAGVGNGVGGGGGGGGGGGNRAAHLENARKGGRRAACPPERRPPVPLVFVFNVGTGLGVHHRAVIDQLLFPFPKVVVEVCFQQRVGDPQRSAATRLKEETPQQIDAVELGAAGGSGRRRCVGWNASGRVVQICRFCGAGKRVCIAGVGVGSGLGLGLIFVDNSPPQLAVCHPWTERCLRLVCFLEALVFGKIRFPFGVRHRQKPRLHRRVGAPENVVVPNFCPELAIKRQPRKLVDAADTPRQFPVAVLQVRPCGRAPRFLEGRADGDWGARRPGFQELGVVVGGGERLESVQQVVADGGGRAAGWAACWALSHLVGLPRHEVARDKALVAALEPEGVALEEAGAHEVAKAEPLRLLGRQRARARHLDGDAAEAVAVALDLLAADAGAVRCHAQHKDVVCVLVDFGPVLCGVAVVSDKGRDVGELAGPARGVADRDCRGLCAVAGKHDPPCRHKPAPAVLGAVEGLDVRAHDQRRLGRNGACDLLDLCGVVVRHWPDPLAGQRPGETVAWPVFVEVRSV